VPLFGNGGRHGKTVGDKIFIAVAPKRGKGDIEEVAKAGSI